MGVVEPQQPGPRRAPVSRPKRVLRLRLRSPLTLAVSRRCNVTLVQNYAEGKAYEWLKMSDGTSYGWP